jgi:Uroporphyrinogen decarboxylase (URO-D)
MPWTTEPLAAEERTELKRLFAARLARVEAMTADVFSFRADAPTPFLVNSCFYHLFGQAPALIPDDYFTSPESMTVFQERTSFEQMKSIDDAFVPCLVPWFGSGVLATGFGCGYQVPAKMDPAVDPSRYPVRTPQDIRALRLPDPEKDGLMPAVLRFQRFMKAHGTLPVGITDCQGPLTTANQLMGYDSLIYLMADHPTALHALMDVVTEGLIAWVKKQKEVIGEAMNESFTEQQVYLGGHGGIWMSDDDAILMSPQSYREFVVPYNARVLQAFGGGCLHTCGNTLHQADNLLATEGLRVFNNYSLHALKPLAEMKRRFEGRIVVYLCDFTPDDYDGYFAEIFQHLSPGGLVIDSQFSPVLALLKGGQYSALQRDRFRGRQQVYEALSRRARDAALRAGTVRRPL